MDKARIMNQKTIPEGYMLDSRDRLVPEEHVDEVDIVRDDLVRNLIAKGLMLHEDIRRFRSDALSEVKSFIQLAAQKYDVTIGGRKGNISMTSYDGTRMIKVQVSDLIRFDERVEVAKELLTELGAKWADTPGVPSELKIVVEETFRTNAEGQLSVSRIVSLMRWKITHPTWLKAMDILRDSLHVVGSAEYIRLYQREDSKAQWRAISLDIAKL